MKPAVSAIHQDRTHRLIPARYNDDTALRRIAANERDLQSLIDLDSATNDRLIGEANLLPGISVHELLFGVDHASVVNAAFTHSHPEGSRFNDPERGAWYAGFELKTAQAEVAFHKAQELQEIGWDEPETFDFDDYQADCRAQFHDLRGSDKYRKFLDPGSYAASQDLARNLLATGSAGIVYPSVRYSKGTCLVCFRPTLVANVRQEQTLTLRFRDAHAIPRW